MAIKGRRRAVRSDRQLDARQQVVPAGHATVRFADGDEQGTTPATPKWSRIFLNAFPPLRGYDARTYTPLRRVNAEKEDPMHKVTRIATMTIILAAAGGPFLPTLNDVPTPPCLPCKPPPIKRISR